MALSSMLCSAVTMLAQPPVQPIRPIPRPRPSTLTLPLSRENFPFDFTFGASTSALQIEGASNNHCKGPNIWDDFILKFPDLDPYVTIFHFDLPQALQEKYGGVLGAEFIDDYVAFADLCFEKFGKKVKKWITMNEPLIFCNGYTGSFPPLRSSEWQNIRGSVGGDAAVEPYIASHNLLLAHAAAVKRYRDCYKNPVSKEEIGITLNSAWYVPYSDHKDDKEAALRALDFSLGLYLNPITYGDYPESVRSLVGNRLPKFTQEQSDLLRKSYDFIGLNYYHAYYAANDPTINNPPSFKTDSLVRNTSKNSLL
ncbi:hypothetical protein L6164_017527 [Bauhinia variegata]|uniref:Uncharacterized protein n=1 Tax=Bauhinia variegata TaxID=167791 RepID=A0ACB9N874_BAUVA|nr:hypothetical protein L6164_017527 [Bauhinia variegata]